MPAAESHRQKLLRDGLTGTLVVSGLWFTGSADNKQAYGIITVSVGVSQSPI